MPVTRRNRAQRICKLVTAQTGALLDPCEPLPGTMKTGAGAVGVNWLLTSVENDPAAARVLTATITADANAGKGTVRRGANVTYGPLSNYIDTDDLVYCNSNTIALNAGQPVA